MLQTALGQYLLWCPVEPQFIEQALRKKDLAKTPYFNAGTAPRLEAGPQGSSRRRDDSH